MNYHIVGIKKRIEPLRQALLQHQLYSKFERIEDLQAFMEYHVFAVWDFMALLKGLQIRLTSTSEAWVPTANPTARRLINEIVLAEESDLDQEGVPASHYELYLAAMKQCGADTQPIVRFTQHLLRGYSHKSVVKYNLAEVPEAIVDFLMATYRILKRDKAHEIASAFTFGREDLIPDLFAEIVRDLDRKFPEQLTAFIYYLDRHIELDGDEHGPMANKMIQELCGNDELKWQEATDAAVEALEARLALWDAIAQAIDRQSAPLLALE